MAKGVQVLKQTGSPNQAIAAVSSVGVKPKTNGIGKARTAGQAAFKPVVRGINEFWRKWRRTRGAAVGVQKQAAASGAGNFEGNNF